MEKALRQKNSCIISNYRMWRSLLRLGNTLMMKKIAMYMVIIIWN